MADLSDVVDALASLADLALYPNGDNHPSVAGVAVTIAPGWPIPKQLDAIIKAGNAMMTVYPMPGMDQNVTRFLNEEPQETATPSSSLTMTVSGNEVTVGGAINAGEAAYIGVNRTPYTHAVVASDTPATIAAALAAQIPGASVSGAIVTIGGSVYDIQAGVSAIASLQTEIARQKRVFMLTAWCPSPSTRDAIAQAVDVSFKAIPGRRITLADGTYGILIYRGTLQTDEMTTRKVFRRDLRYEVEYGTTQASSANTITNTQTTFVANGDTIQLNTP